VVVVACEPADTDPAGPGLTPQVAASVDRAVDLVLATVGELRQGGPVRSE
jgi:Ni,Fe-hydrogenase maturation factor